AARAVSALIDRVDVKPRAEMIGRRLPHASIAGGGMEEDQRGLRSGPLAVVHLEAVRQDHVLLVHGFSFSSNDDSPSGQRHYRICVTWDLRDQRMLREHPRRARWRLSRFTVTLRDSSKRSPPELMKSAPTNRLPTAGPTRVRRPMICCWRRSVRERR